MEDIILGFIAGIFVGWWWHARSVSKHILSNPDVIIDILNRYKKDQEKVIKFKEQVIDSTPVKIERHADMFYIFSADDNEFISQGKTVEDALEAAKVRFPDQNFHGVIPKEEADAWGLSNKQ